MIRGEGIKNSGRQGYDMAACARPFGSVMPQEDLSMTAPAETRICPFMSGGKENVFVTCRGEECMAWYAPEHHAGEDALRPMPVHGWCRLIEGKMQ